MYKKLEWCPCLYQLIVVLFILLVGLAVMHKVNASTQDNWDVDGEHGQLYVHGELTEGACRLEMSSAYQDVNMGTMTNSTLVHKGDQLPPVTFNLHLKDCLHSGGDVLYTHSGTESWSNEQPVVSVRFQGPKVTENPDLIKVAGIRGVGLQIKDSEKHSVHLDEWGKPHFVEPGSDLLSYSISLVKTDTIDTSGSWYAMVNFALSYD